MNKQETLALFAQGRDAWNAWAAEMLAERKRLEAAGGDFSKFSHSDGVAKWERKALADFSGETFEKDVSFAEFIFPGNANFRAAAFSGYADFREAAFSDYAIFEKASFSDNAVFEKATFSDYAIFEKAVFSDYAIFDHTTVENAVFFTRIKALSLFTMGQAVFSLVPEFGHADFKPEAPRLDSLRIEPRGFWPRLSRLARGEDRAEPNGPRRWRVLQRLANDGHDHASEQRFFRGELLAKRGLEQQWKTAPFTFFVSLVYQVTSNFGAWLILPMLWWALGVVGFAWFYLTEHVARLANVEASMASPSGRIIRRLRDGLDGFACIDGAGDPLLAALGLSMSKSLFAGFGPARALDQIHACLFGIHEPEVFGGFQPVMPYLVTGVGVAQFLLSAIVIFLFGLALRNHFKIK